MLKGQMDFRIGNERHSMSAGDVAVIPGDTEHEDFFPEDTEVVDVFSLPREDLLDRKNASENAYPACLS
jgi:quercetin dioxygenase-like cupin family protein